MRGFASLPRGTSKPGSSAPRPWAARGSPVGRSQPVLELNAVRTPWLPCHLIQPCGFGQVRGLLRRTGACCRSRELGKNDRTGTQISEQEACFGCQFTFIVRAHRWSTECIDQSGNTVPVLVNTGANYEVLLIDFRAGGEFYRVGIGMDQGHGIVDPPHPL